MPARGTIVEFRANLRAVYDAALPVDARGLVLLHPYAKAPGEDPVPIGWADVRATVDSEGSAAVWCPLRSSASQGDAIPGTEYHDGDVPQWTDEQSTTPDPDQQYVDLLKTTGSAFLAALRDGRWHTFVEKFKSLDQSSMDSMPAYRGASEILELLMDVVRL